MDEKIMYRNVKEYLEIMDIYPLLDNFGKTMYTAHAYYPIAVMEFDMEEMVFEDFEPIESAILKCMEQGINTASGIASFLGLPNRYIDMHIHDLEGKQQISQGKLTEIGRQSLAENQMIRIYNNSRQKFQVDALFGYMLEKRFYQGVSRQNDLLETKSYYWHIKYEEEIDAKHLIEQLMGDELIKKYRRRVLNSNVTSINEITFKKLFFVPVFVIWKSELEHPLFFFRTYAQSDSQKVGGQAYSYEPLYLPRSAESIMAGKEIHCVEDEQMDNYTYIWKRYCRELEPTIEDVKEYLQGKPFDVNMELEANLSDGPRTVEFSPGKGRLTMDSIEIIVASIIGNVPITHIMKDLSENRKSAFRKRISYIPTISDPVLLEYAEKIIYMWKHDFAELTKRRANMDSSEGELIDLLKELLQEGEAEDE